MEIFTTERSGSEIRIRFFPRPGSGFGLEKNHWIGSGSGISWKVECGSGFGISWKVGSESGSGLYQTGSEGLLPPIECYASDHQTSKNLPLVFTYICTYLLLIFACRNVSDSPGIFYNPHRGASQPEDRWMQQTRNENQLELWNLLWL